MQPIINIFREMYLKIKKTGILTSSRNLNREQKSPNFKRNKVTTSPEIMNKKDYPSKTSQFHNKIGQIFKIER